MSYDIGKVSGAALLADGYTGHPTLVDGRRRRVAAVEGRAEGSRGMRPIHLAGPGSGAVIGTAGRPLSCAADPGDGEPSTADSTRFVRLATVGQLWMSIDRRPTSHGTEISILARYQGEQETKQNR